MIRLDSVTKRFGGEVAVDNLSLDVDRGEVAVLLGPSGCGKTTTLRMINRLVEPSAGRIVVDGEDVSEVDPVRLRRKIGYVIQQAGLFPHRTVAENVETVPRLLGWDRNRRRHRVNELLELVGLRPDDHGARYPDQLSGGQQQRVGVARALAADPPVLLMDEPFGALDPITRSRLQDEFVRLQQELRKTVVFVTHDVDEAVRIGDRIAILQQGGRLAQYASPADVLGNPASPFVAAFVGSDRGLKRLAVTTIDSADVEKPPVVSVDSTPAEAKHALAVGESRWAIVVDAGDRLCGWIGQHDLGDDGRSVSDLAHPLPAVVETGSSLKAAFSEMLVHDVAWVAVVDRGRYVGVLTPDSLHAALRRSVGDG